MKSEGTEKTLIRRITVVGQEQDLLEFGERQLQGKNSRGRTTWSLFMLA